MSARSLTGKVAPYDRLDRLFEISKVLTRFESLEQSVPEVLEIVASAFPITCAILVLGGEPQQTIVWQVEGVSQDRVQATRERAYVAYSYLRGANTTWPVVLTGERELAVTLPLVVAGRRILGVIAFESTASPAESDLMFVNTVANQLAIALDRHAIAQGKQRAVESGRTRAVLGQARAERERTVAQESQISAEVDRERFEALVDNLDSAFVWEADARTMRVSYVSARAEALLGYPRRRWLEEPDFWASHLDPADRQNVLDVLGEVLEGQQDRRIDHRFTKADGGTLWLQTGVHLSGADTCLPRFQGVSVDVTPLKEAEEAAHRAIRSRDSMMAIVAHDLLNPLGSIILGAGQLLGTLPRDAARNRRQADIVCRSARRMERLVRDLLDFASIEGGHLALDFQSWNAVSLIVESVELQEPAAGEKSQSLKAEIGTVADHAMIECDRGRMLQVLTNIIGNAVKFTPTGGRIVVRADEVSDRIRIAVSDSGPGIPADSLPKLFDAYWGGEASAREGGSGLGLFIAKGLVEAHGGKVWIQSWPRTGTTVYLELPLAQAAERVPDRP